MSVMFEVYYGGSADPAKEAILSDRVAALGGRLDHREDATGATGIVLTYEFDSWDMAQRAASALRQLGEHVEGPMEYGP